MIKVGLIGYGAWGKILYKKLEKFCDIKFTCRSKDTYLDKSGIAPGHTPLLTGLAPGPVRVQNGDDEKTFFCSGGFIEIQPDLVTFLSDRAERAESMDEAEAIKAQELAEKNMHDKESELDYTKAAAQLAEAAARIKTIQKLRKNK